MKKFAVCLSIFILLILICHASTVSDQYGEIEQMIKAGKFEEAKRIASEILCKNENDLNARRLMALALLREDKLAAALKENERCFDIVEEGKKHKTTDWGVNTNMLSLLNLERADILQSMNKYDKALPYLEKANQITPGNKDILIGLYLSYANCDQCTKAESTYDEYRQKFGEDIPLMSMLVQCYEKVNNYSDCARIWGNLIKRNPDNFELHVEMANDLICWSMCPEAWFEARVAYLLTGSGQIESLLNHDLKNICPEPPGTQERAEQYVKQLKETLKNQHH